tara:strand:+ start:399 stop:899 length:501 start_codon:yes stop_codon:yes gene_type:complete
MFHIHELPKEALFSLFLQIEPEELKTVSFSKNKKVREICNSKYFQEVYKKKYCKIIFFDKKDASKIKIQWLACNGFHMQFYIGSKITDIDVPFKKGIVDIGKFLEQNSISLKIGDITMIHIEEAYVIINIRVNLEIKIPFDIFRLPLTNMKNVFDDLNQNYPEYLS